MIQHATLVPDKESGLESNLGTMVINDEDQEKEDDVTMRSNFIDSALGLFINYVTHPICGIPLCHAKLLKS